LVGWWCSTTTAPATPRSVTSRIAAISTWHQFGFQDLDAIDVAASLAPGRPDAVRVRGQWQAQLLRLRVDGQDIQGADLAELGAPEQIPYAIMIYPFESGRPTTGDPGIDFLYDLGARLLEPVFNPSVEALGLGDRDGLASSAVGGLAVLGRLA
jgi:hypothetical protein